MFTVYRQDNTSDSFSLIDPIEFPDYESAISYAKKIATKPVYNQPDPNGIYVLIFDDDHDSPRWTSW